MATRHTPTPTGHQTATQTRQRIAWVDFAKAAAIILVVLYHIGGSGVNYLFPTSDGPASPFWDTVNQVLLPMRMPLFFLTAGILAHHAIARNWSTIWHTKITVLIWPYLLWSIGFAFLAGYAYTPDTPWSYTTDRIIGLPFGFSGYWFLAILAIFFITAKLFRSRPTTLLVLSLILALAAPFLEAAIPATWSGIYTYAPVKASRYAFWYFLGCFAAQHASRISHMNPWTLIFGGGAAFTAITLTAWDNPPHRTAQRSPIRHRTHHRSGSLRMGRSKQENQGPLKVPRRKNITDLSLTSGADSYYRPDPHIVVRTDGSQRTLGSHPATATDHCLCLHIHVYS
ncbi:MAG: acyltransferase family protein [Micrococcaceae bacterium]|nr:acyltransferase family protein [Micrococcaceae bacterium]